MENQENKSQETVTREKAKKNKDHTEKRNHYIYMITNIQTKEYYVGMRSTHCVPEKDVYMGSGKRIRASIRKYGKENFKKEILIADIESRDALAVVEASIITRELLLDDLCLNLAVGGFGQKPEFKHLKPSMLGYKFSNEQKKHLSNVHQGQIPWNKGIPRTAEDRKTISESLTGKTYPSRRGTHLTEEHKQRIRETLVLYVIPEETKKKISEKLSGENHPMFGKKHTEAARKRMSESHKKPLSEEHKRALREGHTKRKLKNKENEESLNESTN